MISSSHELSIRRFFVGFLYIGIPFLVSLIASILDEPAKIWLAQSSSFFNQLFAKYAWAWATLISVLLTNIQYRLGKLRISVLHRWVWATVYWALFTQNFFGPSFRDKVFLATGGICSLGEASSLSQCKAYGSGGWIGGHRISGHCFLLIHASLFLWEEFGPVLYTPLQSKHERNNQTEYKYSSVDEYIIYGARAILVLFLWLLMITCVYFHTLLERLSGIALGSLFWIVSYFYVYPMFGV